MTRRIFRILLGLLSVNTLQSQCLISNGSFEVPTNQQNSSYWNCYAGGFGDTSMRGLFNPLLGGTPDIFNRCGNYILSPQDCELSLCIPRNAAGYRETHSGNAYGGFLNYYKTPLINSPGSFQIGREYIGFKLRDTLKHDKCYNFRMHLAFAQVSLYMSPDFGVVFTDTMLKHQVVNQLDYSIYLEADIVNPPTNFDTLNWFVVEGNYIAKGGERFLSIGNFLPDSQSVAYRVPSMNWSNLPETEMLSYYYIDDVTLIPCESDTVEQRSYVLCAGDSLRIAPDSSAYTSCHWSDSSGKTLQMGFAYTLYPTTDTLLHAYLLNDTFTCAPHRLRVDIKVVPDIGSSQSHQKIICPNVADTLYALRYPHVVQRWFTATDTLSSESYLPIQYSQDQRIYLRYSDTLLNCRARIDTYSIKIDIPLCTAERYIHPTAFTPNGDGKNETFYPICAKPCKVELLRIYNSWGEVVHEGDTPWDGTYRANPHPIGAYWYRSRIDGLPFHGVVTLLR